ncbi:hypothetical protein LJR296_008137 [Cupriavidus necator]|uniref:hypothetical protein n=1 Tax=Cupriavidus necator TaxID=106590 RepID=UPI003ED09DE1
MSLAVLEADEKRLAGGSIFKHLAIEMLELAAADLARPLPRYQDQARGAQEARLNHESAKRWIADKSGDAATIPFTLCCDALGVDPQVVAAALLSDPKTLLEKLRLFAKREEQGPRASEHLATEANACCAATVRPKLR